MKAAPSKRSVARRKSAGWQKWPRRGGWHDVRRAAAIADVSGQLDRELFDAAERTLEALEREFGHSENPLPFARASSIRQKQQHGATPIRRLPPRLQSSTAASISERLRYSTVRRTPSSLKPFRR